MKLCVISGVHETSKASRESLGIEPSGFNRPVNFHKVCKSGILLYSMGCPQRLGGGITLLLVLIFKLVTGY